MRIACLTRLTCLACMFNMAIQCFHRGSVRVRARASARVTVRDRDRI